MLLWPLLRIRMPFRTQAKTELLKSSYGTFMAAAQGEKKITFIENELLKIGISNKGGRIVFCSIKKIPNPRFAPADALR